MAELGNGLRVTGESSEARRPEPRVTWKAEFSSEVLGKISLRVVGEDGREACAALRSGILDRSVLFLPTPCVMGAEVDERLLDLLLTLSLILSTKVAMGGGKAG